MAAIAKPLPYDSAKAVSHLLAKHHGRRTDLVVIHPESGHVEAQTFMPAEHEAMRVWIDLRQGVFNVYYSPNEIRESVRNRRAKKVDIIRAWSLYVDYDQRDGLEAALSKLPPPTEVIDTGGGFHIFWALSSPSDDFALIEAINAGLAEAIGGDKCFSIDHLYRVPFTANIPNARKRTAGRVPVVATLVEYHPERVYDIEAFREFAKPRFDRPDSGSKAAPVTTIVPLDLTALPDMVSEATRRIIELGDDPERPFQAPDRRFPSRSEAVFFVVCDLARANVSPEIIAGILINPAFGISQSILERKGRAHAYALKQAAAGAAAVQNRWPDVDKAGTPRPTFRNSLVALGRLGLSFRFDLFRQRKMIGGSLLDENQGEISDDAVMFLRGRILDAFGFDPKSEHVRDAINLLCLENAFHPIREELASLDWDGTPRLDEWMIFYLGAAGTPLNRAIGRILLIAAVRRVRQPGVKFDQIVVLEGPQGSGKSSAVRILAGPGNHSDQEILTLDAKAQIEMLEGVWFQELSEVEGMSKGEVNKIKAFASRQVDRARMAYAYFAVARPRQAVFVGTTNDDKYLRDQTGNRRFWPVKTGTIDLEGLARDRNQLFAEAAHREAEDDSISLPEELWGAATEEQALRLEDDPWIEKIEEAAPAVVGETLRHYTRALLTLTLEIPAERQNQGHTKRLATLMRKLGWESDKFHVEGKVVRGYVKPKPADFDPSAYRSRLY